MNIRGKLMVITGVSSGIGRDLALTAAKLGATVVGLARREDRLRELLEEITRAEGKAFVYPLDVADRATFESVARTILEVHGVPDFVVNNAGYGRWEAVVHASIGDIEHVMDVNYLGVVLGTKLFLPAMLKRGSGRIVNIASIAGEYASPNLASYCAAKAAVIAFSQSLAGELHGTGVTVSVVNPGPVPTEFHSGETWRERKPHSPLISATTADCTKAILHVLETGGFKVFVPFWWGWAIWKLRAIGPAGRWIVNLRRALRSR